MKTLRMRRLLRHGRGLFTPLDHGATLGPIAGIETIENTVRTLAESGRVDAVILHKGPLERCAEEVGMDVNEFVANLLPTSVNS